VENYDAARQTIDDNVIKHQKYFKKKLQSLIWSMRFAPWITETTDTHFEY